jgi:cytochrome P450/NADPH-cytochrome P450 reductase
VPTELDAGLEQHGAKRIHPRGAGDVRGDFDAAYRNWHDTLWKDIATTLGVDAPHETDESQPRLSITVTNRQVTNPVIMSYHAQAAVVRDNHELLGTNAGRSTRHVEVALPSGAAYKAGDHLGVLPRNNINLIRRVMLHFGAGRRFLPHDHPEPRQSHSSAHRRASPATRHLGQLCRATGSGDPQRHRGDG